MKQTLAASLHEIAKILESIGDSTLVEEELIPVFEAMIQVSFLVSINLIISDNFSI